MVVDLVVMGHEQQALAEVRCDDDERDDACVAVVVQQRNDE